MPTRRLEFWYEFASTYSYLSAMRIETVAAAAKVEVAWRPFLLGPIFRAQGWNDSPFNLYPAKGRYMWRDLERLAAGYGLPWRRPSAFPRNGLLAARIALAAEPEGWCADWTRAVFSAEFAHDRDIGDGAVLAGLLETLGQEPGAVLARAESDENKARLRAQTERATALGIFGAPSFVVPASGDELYWGNDRLGDAIAKAALG
jgi:2-hydroxychromene-2-carboxylate isomerase